MTTTLSQLATDLSNAVSAKATGGKPAKASGKATGPKASGKPRQGAAKAASAPVAAGQASTPAKAQKPSSGAQRKAPVASGVSDRLETRYALGKPFVAKAGGRFPQAENWAALLPLLPATKAELVAALKAADRPNAAGFVQGRIRGGHIVASE